MPEPRAEMIAAPILEAVGLVMRDEADRAEERFQLFRAEILERLAEVAAIEPAPGRDGVDRILALPRYVKEGESCEANCIAWANAGIWQSVRATSGGPLDDPSGWKCLVPGVSQIETREDWTRRELVIGLRMSDGTLHECRGRMPATRLPADYLARGWGVLAGDTLRPEGEEVEFLALKDGAALGDAEAWAEYRLRGSRGQKGLRGDPGPRGTPGPGLTGLALVDDPQRGLTIVPRFSDPAVKAEPIEVDLLAADPPPGLQPIVGFAGDWASMRTYRRGEVVKAIVAGQPRLLLSIRSDNNAGPDDARAWQVML